MFSSVLSAVICGIECQGIHVEADVSDGLPGFAMVGYLGSQVREAQERVRTALKNSGIMLRPKRITVNLSPADLRKDGTAFDLPIALAVLSAYGYLPGEQLDKVLAVGELSLNGELKGVRGVLPAARQAALLGCRLCLVPKANEKEGGLIDGVKVVGAESLSEVLEFLTGRCDIPPADTNIEEIKRKSCVGAEDFQNIMGQQAVKRAAEVAAAGMHNLLLVGPPGTGKSMVASCIPGILPKLTLEESMEISEIYSVAGLLDNDRPLILSRPFRAPHHTITAQALAGGGRIPRPGEISLAHRGVLFLDELPEFSNSALEVLRQPAEEGMVRISRASGNYSFPAGCMLVAAMNPCKCGYYPDLLRCTCTEAEIHRYLRKISRPLVDRMDISIEASPIAYKELRNTGKEESSRMIRDRVVQAQEIQQERYRETGYQFNRDLDAEGIRRYCSLGLDEDRLLESAYAKFGMSARACHRILKVARTIADLEASERIQAHHLGEAVCYRSAEQKYWQ